MTERERTAVEAVAQRFSATWERGSGSADADLLADGRRVAVEIRTLPRRGGGARPRLRFDGVATRVMERLRASAGQTAPDGVTVLLTLTAPIRLPSKTAAALEEKIRGLAGRGAAGGDERDTIHGNRVQMRVMRDGSGQAAQLVGFVHNPDSDPALLLNVAGDLVEFLGAEGGRRTRKGAGERWLVALREGESLCAEAYRTAASQLRMPTGFQQVLVVFGDGEVEVLRGRTP